MNEKPLQEPKYTGLAITLGMMAGAAVGFAIWIATDTFVFFPVGIVSGLTVGLAFIERLKSRASNEDENDPPDLTQR